MMRTTKPRYVMMAVQCLPPIMPMTAYRASSSYATSTSTKRGSSHSRFACSKSMPYLARLRALFTGSYSKSISTPPYWYILYTFCALIATTSIAARPCAGMACIQQIAAVTQRGSDDVSTHVERSSSAIPSRFSRTSSESTTMRPTTSPTPSGRRACGRCARRSRS